MLPPPNGVIHGGFKQGGIIIGGWGGGSLGGGGSSGSGQVQGDTLEHVQTTGSLQFWFALTRKTSDMTTKNRTERHTFKKTLILISFKILSAIIS
jgi:hypothetical protein